MQDFGGKMKTIDVLVLIAVFLSFLLSSCSEKEFPDAEIEAALVAHDEVGTGVYYEKFSYTVSLKEVLDLCNVLDAATTVQLTPCINDDIEEDSENEDNVDTEDTVSRDGTDGTSTGRGTESEEVEEDACRQLDIKEIGLVKRGKQVDKTFTVKVNGVVDSIALIAIDWRILDNCDLVKKDSNNVCLPGSEAITGQPCEEEKQ